MNIKRKKFNISLLGDNVVGKSTIVNYLKSNRSSEDFLYSIGINEHIDEVNPQ